jgi:outer membrane protein, heavy metal efflux system
MNRFSHIIPSVCMFLLLCTLPGCYNYRHTTIKELESVRKKTEQAIDYDIDWTAAPKPRGDEYHSPQEMFTIESAVYQAIVIDPTLQAFFEQLGINKADFVQACYFQNPYLNYNVQYSKSICNQTIIYGFFSMNVNDFWQIPRRKRVAQTELEITTIATLQRILEIKNTIEIAYFKYLFEKMQFAAAEKLNSATKQLREVIEQKYYAGYQSDYDRLVGDSFVTLNEIRMIEQNRSLANAATTLRSAIGLDVNNNQINVAEDTWKKLFMPLPSPEEIFAYAKRQKPELQIARMRIRQAQEQIALERSRIIDNVQFGLGWTALMPTPPSSDLPTSKKVFDIGPFLTMPIPIFDQRQMAIERACRQEEKSRREAEALEGALFEEIYNLHTNITAAREKIDTYKNKLLPAIDASLAYAQKYDTTLQVSFSIYYSTGISLLEQEFLMNAEYLNLAILTSTLEKTIGGNLKHILAEENNSDIVKINGTSTNVITLPKIGYKKDLL